MAATRRLRSGYVKGERAKQGYSTLGGGVYAAPLFMCTKGSQWRIQRIVVQRGLCRKDPFAD